MVKKTKNRPKRQSSLAAVRRTDLLQQQQQQSSSSTTRRQRNNSSRPQHKQSKDRATSQYIDEGVPLPKQGPDYDLSPRLRPPQLSRSSGAGGRQTSSSSRPGAFAIDSRNRDGRSRSDGDFSISELTHLADQSPALTGPATTISGGSAPVPSGSASELSSEAPIVATLVEDIGPAKASFDPDIVPEAIRASMWSDRRVRLVIGILVAMVIVAVGAVIWLLVFGGGEKVTEESIDIFPQDLTPSVAPTLTPTSIEQEVLDVLVGASFDRGAALFNVSTPQKLAFEWLLDDPNVVSYAQARILQRYALATLYYSSVLDNDESEFTNQPLGDDECLDLEYVTCDNAGSLIAVEHAWTSTTRGTLPDELGLLSDVQVLDFSNNRFRGTLPTTLGLLTELTALRLRYNHFSGTIQTQIGNLSKLVSLGLEGNAFFGSIPPALGKLSELRWMGLHTNRFVGSIPETMWTMTKLQNLYISNNQLTGTVSTSIGQLFDLRDVSFGGNKLLGTLPVELANLESLVKIHFGENVLTGTLPVVIFERLSNLRYLNLGYNRFQGSIPSQLSALTSLSESLLLNDNMLTMTIPTELGRLRRLEKDCNLSNNLLSGTIPTEMGWLTNLEGTLDLSRNRLSETIPQELGYLSLLSNLRLEGNTAMSGSIPSSFGSLWKLVALALYGSNLTGSLPADVCWLMDVQLTTLELDCDIMCDCCNGFCF